MKKLVTILILAAVAGGGAYYYFVYSNTEEPPQVVTAVVSRGDVTESVQATGTLEAIRTVEVGPQVSGTILELRADFNSIVRQGEIVARLDPSLLQTQVDIQQATIERQETDIEMQRVQLEDAERTYRRTQELFEKGLANQTQLEQAELAIKTRQAQIASAEKQLVQARANLSQAELNVSYTEVKSPIDGVVVNRLVDEGQSVQSSMNITPFFEIATNLRTLRLTAGVDEADIGKIRPGMEVEFTVDTYPNSTFRGAVENVNLNATTQNNVVTYPVWINVPNPDLRLRPSLTANLEIIISTATDVMRIPNQALRFRPTTEMYTALGLTPPERPAGTRVVGAGGRQDDAAGGRQGDAPGGAEPSAPAGEARGQQGAAAPAVGPSPARGGSNGTAGGGRTGGRGNFANLPPEERARLMAGRNGGAGGRGGRVAAPMVAPDEGVGQKIDALFAPVEVRPVPGVVWNWDETTRTLTDLRVTTGINDGQFSQVLTGDVTEGQQLVTSIILPASAAQSNQQQSIFGQQQGGRGGFGGGGGGGRGRGGF